MQEVYRSFEGKLDVGNQRGYIIYDGVTFYEIHFISVWSDEKDHKVRIPKTLINAADFSDREKLDVIGFQIENGAFDSENAQTFYKGKWYSGVLINKIQRARQDHNWKKYI